MSTLSTGYQQYVTVDNCSDIRNCVYCGNYSEPLKDNSRGQVVCRDFENCVWNRVDNGEIDSDRAWKLIGRK
jgi:hypothetical protein